MLDNIVSSTSNSSNIHEVIDDDSNCYRSLEMDAIRKNHGYLDEGSFIKEPSVDATRYFELLKDLDEPFME